MGCKFNYQPKINYMNDERARCKLDNMDIYYHMQHIMDVLTGLCKKPNHI